MDLMYNGGMQFHFHIFSIARAQAGEFHIPAESQYDSGFFGWLTRNLPDSGGIGTGSIFGEGGLFGADLLQMFSTAIAALAILFLVITGARMIFARGDAEAMSRFRFQIVWIAIGLALIGVANIVAFDLFDPTQNLLEGETARATMTDLVIRVLQILKYIMGAFILIMTMISGYNLIIDGDNSQVQEQERNFFQSFLFGVMMVLFAESAVLLLSLPETAITADPDIISKATKRNANLILEQIMGSFRFITSFLVGVSVLIIVLGALYYTTSFGNEQRQEQGKRMVLGAIVAIVIVVSSFTLASFLLAR